MTRVIVLLRGVNVGGRNRVPMAAFREVLGALGLEDVRTLLNSGNAVGRVPARSWDSLAQSTRSALLDTMQVDVPVIVVPEETMHAIVAENTIVAPDRNPSRLFVSFAPEPSALAELSAIAPLVTSDEAFVLGAHAAYLYSAHGVLESKAASALMGRVGRHVTTRNWATVLKLHALLTSIES